jgi:glycosyltransferase involved in cell wall biosynthesis
MNEAGPRYDDSWLVVPLYNEATVIGQVIEDAKGTFTNIVCVDDGSSDGSAAIARQHGARVIEHPFNLGQGAALQTGMEFVRRQTNARYIVTFDADGQHSVADAAAMVDRARTDDLAIIFGSRFLDDATQVGWSKKLVLKTAAAVTKQRTGLNPN